MFTLYIDTHSSTIVLALYKDEKLYCKKEIKESRDHSTICMPSLVQLLEEEKLTMEEINDIVVVNGPGSFTGVRLGVTIAKMLAFTAKKEIRTITSLELFLQENEEVDYLVLEEKNGYYLGKLDFLKNGFVDYFYLTKSEYIEFQKKESVRLCDDIDYSNLITFAHQKEMINPHEVKPIYVKKIEVEK